MGELNGLLSRFEELEMLIIKVAEVLGVILVCLLGLRAHYEKFRRRPKRRSRQLRENTKK
jgi:hypothetical protein